MKRAVIASLLVVTSSACESGARREAQQLAAAVERFRRADNPAKPATVAAIREVSCTDAEVCGAREACLAAAESTGRALELKSEVEQGLIALEKGQLAKESPEAQALPSKLDMAETLLKEGHARLGACEEQLAALKRKHRI